MSPRARSLCEDRCLAADAIWVRPAENGDRRSLALLFAAVAEERDGIAAEPPIDVAERAANWDVDRTLVALAAGEVVGAALTGSARSHARACGNVPRVV
jgi:hypothetical protein